MTESLLAAIVALSGAVVALWRQQTRVLRRIEAKLDTCEKDRAELWKQMARLTIADLAGQKPANG